MPVPGDPRAAAWAGHADAVEPRLLALAILRAVLGGDQADLEVVLGRIGQWWDGGTDESAELIQEFEAQLGLLAVGFGRQAHGDRLDEVLAGLQADWARHVAEFDPGGQR